MAKSRSEKQWPLFFKFVEKIVDGFGPDICQYLWNDELSEMFLDFRCICVWVGVSKVSQYPREIKIRCPVRLRGLWSLSVLWF